MRHDATTETRRELEDKLGQIEDRIATSEEKINKLWGEWEQTYETLTNLNKEINHD